jgi:DNA-binding CsgD family transcriptional regulator/tetratricopeptide (TPR) repeat protein
MLETDSAIFALQRHIIERPRLLNILAGAKERIILLTAPAGYGKTTLARQWARRNPDVVWCTCTSAFGDPAALALAIAREVEPFAPEHARRIRTFLRGSRGEINVPTLADRILAGADNWPDEIWIFVDDHHLIAPSSGGADLVEALVTATARRVMIASRVRPAWAGPSVLYGDALELETTVLTMNEDEVGRVLTKRKPKEVDWFASSAGGWPAIVGLASLTSAQLPKHWDSEMHDYFAREVFALLSLPAQEAILHLALSPSATAAAIEELIGSDQEAILKESADQGFLTPSGAEGFAIHPLLAEFLRGHKRYPKHASYLVDRLFVRFLRDHSWDLAFGLLVMHDRIDLFDDLVWVAVDDLLKTNQASTVAGWVTFARRAGIASPSVDYAQSHVAFRLGDFRASVHFARESVVGLLPRHPYRAAALTQLGWALFFASRIDEAAEVFRASLKLCRDGREGESALWGELNVGLFKADRAAVPLINCYKSLPRGDATHRLRVITAELKAAEVFGGIEDALAEARIAKELLPGVDDPMALTAFMLMFGVGLTLNSRYKEARSILEEADKLCEQHDLAFASRQFLIPRAIAEFGLRKYSRCASLVDRLATIAEATEDAWFEANVVKLRSRLVACGVLRGEIKTPALTLPSDDPEYSECMARVAFAHVAAGRIDEGLALTASLTPPLTPEAEITAAWANAVGNLADGGSLGEALADEALQRSIELGCYDPFVCAYRATPKLLEVLTKRPESRAVVTEVMRRATDVGLARNIGISLTSRPTHKLSPREHEVMQLVTEGLSNREIGKRLFISPVTVKVHLRHAYEKLGVRTRTEAALRAAADIDLGDVR